jgi:hypothetical protein
MQKTIRAALLLLIALPVIVSGQNYVNNPYTRFAFGDLMNSGFSYNKSLGGSAIALRPVNQINYLNPASYTTQDTLSFLFLAGMSGRSSFIKTTLESDNMNNINLDYFAIGFPVTTWLKFSMGLAPFSRAQYHFRQYYEGSDELAIEHRGEGGFNEFYFGTGVQLLKFLSVGFNASYLFGDIQRERSVDVPEQTVASTTITEDFVADDFYFRAGIQLHPYFKDKNEKTHRIVLGATYDFGTNVKLNYQAMTSRNFPSGVTNPVMDTFNIINDSVTYLSLPMKLGIGLSYSYNDQWMFTGEYSQQNFSEGLGVFDMDFDTARVKLMDYSSIRFGAEYIPVPMTDRSRARYFERMRYRIGGHITESYLSIKDQQITDYGFSVGVGLPWRNSQKLYTHTVFDIDYEFGIRGTTDNGLIKESYHILTLGITLHDFWFHKPKYD